jgi:hypothetical protein
LLLVMAAASSPPLVVKVQIEDGRCILVPIASGTVRFPVALRSEFLPTQHEDNGTVDIYLPAKETIECWNECFPGLLPNPKVIAQRVEEASKTMEFGLPYLLLFPNKTKKVLYLPRAAFSMFLDAKYIRPDENTGRIDFPSFVRAKQSFATGEIYDPNGEPDLTETEVSLSSTISTGQDYRYSLAYIFGKIVSAVSCSETKPLKAITAAQLTTFKECLGATSADFHFAHYSKSCAACMEVVRVYCLAPQCLQTGVEVSEEMWKVELARIREGNLLAMYAIPAATTTGSTKEEMKVVVDILWCACRGIMANFGLACLLPSEKLCAFYSLTASDITRHLLAGVDRNLITNLMPEERDDAVNCEYPHKLPLKYQKQPSFPSIVFVRGDSKDPEKTNYWRVDLPDFLFDAQRGDLFASEIAQPQQKQHYASHAKQHIYLLLYRMLMHDLAQKLPSNVILHPLREGTNDNTTTTNNTRNRGTVTATTTTTPAAIATVLPAGTMTETEQERSAGRAGLTKIVHPCVTHMCICTKNTFYDGVDDDAAA